MKGMRGVSEQICMDPAEDTCMVSSMSACCVVLLACVDLVVICVAIPPFVRLCLIACGCITGVFLWNSSLIVVKDVSSLKHNLMLTSSLTCLVLFGDEGCIAFYLRD